MSPCGGREVTDLQTVHLGKLFGDPAFLLDHVGTTKGVDTAYFCMGFSSCHMDGEVYQRRYTCLDMVQVIALDCDNTFHKPVLGPDHKPVLDEHGKPLTVKVVKDKDVIRSFKETFRRYEFILWETPSSTPEWPRFRALLPLDRTLTFDAEIRAAIKYEFRRWTDDDAVWFDLPILSKLPTLTFNSGVQYRARDIEAAARKLRAVSESKRQMAQDIRDYRKRQCEANGWNAMFNVRADGWRNLHKVRQVLTSGVGTGERHSVLVSCIGCIKAATTNGVPSYGPEAIAAFLDEVEVADGGGQSGEQIKNEFRRYFCPGL